MAKTNVKPPKSEKESPDYKSTYERTPEQVPILQKT